MTRHQETLFKKSWRALETARLSREAGDPNAAINRAYYAACYAASAALLKHGETPKSHRGTHNNFHLHFVKSGKLNATNGGILKFAYNLRQRADYDAFTVFEEKATDALIADVERFVKMVESIVR